MSVPRGAAGLGIVVGLAVGLGGCGFSSAQQGPLHPVGTPKPVTVAPGLVFSIATEAGYLAVTQVGKDVSGSFTYYQFSQTAQGHVSTGTENVTGFVSGNTLQLTLTGSVAFSGTTQWQGTIGDDGSVTFEIQQKDGSIQPVRFTPGSADDYNAALAGPQTLVNQWSNDWWATTAATACILSDDSHDARVFVSAAGTVICNAAQALGYTQVSTYFKTDEVLCVSLERGITVAVADDQGKVVGNEICNEVNTGNFPTAPAPSY